MTFHFGAMNSDPARILGSMIGEVLEIDETKVCGKLIRMRVYVDLTKPLRRGIMANMWGGRSEL